MRLDIHIHEDNDPEATGLLLEIKQQLETVVTMLNDQKMDAEKLQQLSNKLGGSTEALRGVIEETAK